MVVAFACSSNSNATPSDKWVSDLCTSSTKFGDVQTKSGDKLVAAFDESDPKAQKKALQDLLTDFEGAANTYRTEFDKLGTLDVKSGKQIHDAWVTEFDANQKSLAGARKQVDALDPDSKSYQDQLNRALQSDNEDTHFRATLSKIDGAQPIIDAIDNDNGCAQVVFSGDTSAPAPGSSPAAHASAAPAATKNQKWVLGLCVAVQSYEDDLTDLSDNLDVNQSDLDALKATMVKFLQNAQARTKTLKSDIDKLGNPDIKDGDKIEADMSAAASDVAAIFDKAVRDGNALNPKAPQSLTTGLETLGQNLSDASDEVSSAFTDIDTKYDTSPLSKIAGDIPECSGFF